MAYTNFTGPVQADFGFQTASYTVADLPAVEDNIFLIASDANGGVGTVVFGKGGQWIDARTDQPVSTNPPTPIPYVGLVSPDIGSTAGGTNITINGFNFTGVTAVSIGGTPVTSFSLVSDIEITAVTAARAAGNVYVNVTNAYGTSADTPGASYTYQVPAVVPVISSTSVPGGWVGGGASNFIINGTGFTSTLVVTFNGNSASFTELSDSQILITNFPGGLTGVANIVVYTSSGTSTPYTGWSYLTTGVITSISPNSGVASGGTNITVSGYGFNTTNQLQFEVPGAGSANATGLSVISDNELTAVTPNIVFTGSANARVSNPSYGFGSFANGVFTFTAAPVLPIITSTSVPGGSVFGGTCGFDLIGSHFTGTTSVTFNGNPATFNVDSDGSIAVLNLPSGTAGTATIIVTNGDGASSPYTGWSYEQTPTITYVSPTSGSSAGGTNITVYGYALQQMTECLFIGATDTQNRSGITSTNDNIVTFTTPAHAAEITQLRGWNNTYGPGPVSSPLYTFTAPPPVISGTSVNGGHVGGGSSFWTLFGTGFTGATSVTFQGNPATFTVLDDNGIRITNVPAGSAGNGNIVVTTPAGSSNTWASWQYVTTGVISSITPNTGSNAGGTSLTVSGYGFNTSTQAQFSIPGVTSANTGISVVNDNEFTVTSPSISPFSGATDVRTYNPSYGYGSFATGVFTYTASTPSFTVGNILNSQGNGVASAGNIAMNQLTGTKMLVGQSNALLAVDFAGSFGPWNPTGTSPTPTYQYAFGGQSGSTNNFGFTLNGNFYVSWDYSANILWGYSPNNGPWDWTGGATLYGPVSVPSFSANYGQEAAFTLDYNGYHLYVFNNTAVRQYNLPSQYNINFVNNGADDAYDISVDGISALIKAAQWNNGGTHLYLLVDDGKIWRYTASTPWIVSTLNSPVQVFDANAPGNTAIYGTPNFNYHSAGISVKGDTEDKIMLYMHTSYLFATENFLIQLNG